jgi:hypothetical protein
MRKSKPISLQRFMRTSSIKTFKTFGNALVRPLVEAPNRLPSRIGKPCSQQNAVLSL